MHIGRYKVGEKVWVVVCTHRFENGEEFNATVNGYYLKVGAGFGTKVALTFNLMDSETGIYYAEIDTAGFDESNYLVIVEATIDTVNVNTPMIFEVRSIYGIYAP